MSKINFLSDNKNSGRTGDVPSNKEGTEELNIEWTRPEEITKNDISESNVLAGNNDILFKSKDSGIFAAKTDKNKSLGFFKNIFGSKKIPAAGGFDEQEKDENQRNSGFNNKKKIIAGYGDIINGEKGIRKNYNDAQNIIKNEIKPSETDSNTELPYDNKWKAPKILKTDLIKDEVTIFIDWKKNIKNILANLVMAMIIVAIAYFGLELWGKSSAQQVKTLNNEITDLAQKIIKSKVELKNIDEFQKKLVLAGKIIDQHIYWTNFFNFLEKNTLPDVSFKGGFKGNTSGTYNFSATAPNYSSLVDQVKVLKADTTNVTAVEVSKGSLAGGAEKTESSGKNNSLMSVEFNILLTVNPKIFSR